MKKYLLIVFIGLVVFAVIVGGFILYLQITYPRVRPAPVLKISATPLQIERGMYLARHVAVCIDCHSTRNWKYLTGPIIPGTEGKGGEIFPRAFGYPGNFYSKNITPASIGGWTDGEVYRAVVSGVDKNDVAFFPVMPYHNYGRMDREDVYAMIAYIRTLKPIENKVPASDPDFPFSFIIRTIPRDPDHKPRPDTSDILNYGQYLLNAAACSECHTKKANGEAVPEMEMAGGSEFPMPGGKVYSANLTPDKKTGIGNLSREDFIGKFKLYRTAASRQIPAAPDQFNTPMPWTMYAGMNDQDLGAIYEYLKTIKPVKNAVIKFKPGRSENN